MTASDVVQQRVVALLQVAARYVLLENLLVAVREERLSRLSIIEERNRADQAVNIALDNIDKFDEEMKEEGDDDNR